jgi:hypothetical protein
MDWVNFVWIVAAPVMAGTVWKIVRVENDLNEFRLEVAKNYATHKSLKEVEARLIKLLDKIEKKIDRLVQP